MNDAQATPEPPGQVDPYKWMVRASDIAIVVKGGKSIFACKPRGTPTPQADNAMKRWVDEAPIIQDWVAYVRPGRPANIKKPGRILGTAMGILGGRITDEEW